MAMWADMQGGGKRELLVAHRRAGKDDNCLHYMATAAVQKPATYWYMLPQKNQVRRAIWDAVNPHTGLRRIDEAFPPAICQGKRKNEMVIELINGSMVHFIGSDSFDALVGSPPYGLVFSEFSLTNPNAWAFLRPILDENGGWAIFNMTPRGKNHAYQLYRYALERDDWFVQVSTPADTGVFSPEQLTEARAEYVALYGPEDGEALYQQEYWCSFDVALVGSYYGRYIADAEQAGRIKAVPYDPILPVVTAWDLGMDDYTAIWCVQFAAGEIRVIDYIEGSGRGLDYYAKALLSRPWVYADHLLPHDVQVRELGTGKSRLEVLHSLGLHQARAVPAQSIGDGINAVRSILPRCWFDATRCKQGVEALRMYRRQYDDAKKIYLDRPEHDWSSHAADAFRYLALGMDEREQKERKPLRYRNLRVV
jgi:hypothetical protein